ncbi:terpene cyclase/mutase family protein [Weizmannia sp. CD-2023]|uniref:prenyltransferase/squalene oxidase repeat-containing protein n=1 Tax=Heyndrickxia TaxID=2837504 RepID=UPI000553351D|nr:MULTISPECIES: prenyltransferase/squalene oxidase repeat-containing protein [Heyndrickxia]KGT38792.1 terpenoid cyclase [Heyndrickxia coagulans P38]MBQ4911757.1 terpene cyclase/mutase family protein [Heyndrickxia faecalis]MED4320377.1 terpene cyclase/mutase family protein [Weizmannia sp. CD-2023]
MVGKSARRLFLGIVFVLAFAVPIHSFAAGSVTESIQDTAGYFQKSPDFFKKSELDSDLVVAALAKKGLLQKEEITDYTKTISHKLQSSNVSRGDLDKAIIAIKAMGGDPAQFNGRNLVKEVYTSPADKPTATVYAFDLIALSTDDYTIPSNAENAPAKIAAKLVNLEVKINDGAATVGGGWSWDTSGQTPPDVDSTGMVLTALGMYQKYYHDPSVKKAIRDGKKFLMKAQKSNGGYDYNSGISTSLDGVNSSSTAQAIIGLSSIGIDPTSNKFTKNHVNPVSFLLNNFKIDNGFKWLPSDKVINDFATEEVFEALVAYDLFLKGDTLYNFRNVSSSNSGNTGATDSGAGDKDSGSSNTGSKGSDNSPNNNGTGKTTSQSPAAAAAKVVEKHAKEVVTKTNTITKDHTITNNNTITKTNTVEKPAATKNQTPAKAEKVSHAKKEDKPAAATDQATPAEDVQQEPKKVVITKTTGISPVHGWVGSLSAGAGVILLIISKKFLGV